MQRPEDTKALERRTPVTLVRTGEVARDVAGRRALSAKIRTCYCVL